MDFDLKEMSIEDLRALRDEVAETLKSKRAEAKETDTAEKAKRDAEMRASLTVGDKVIVKFGKGTVEGTIKRLSEKTVTVEAASWEKAKYRKYSEVLRIVEKAEKAA